MLKEVERQTDFFEICSKCKIDCCRDARPPITSKRKQIIEEYLKRNGIAIEKPFSVAEYTFPREDASGHCVFYDKNSKKCKVHPVKPETCAAGPVTFDINKKTQKIEWYLKTEEICHLAGVLYKNKNMLERHFEQAKREVLTLVRELNPKALKAILKRDEPDTFKIGEDEIGEDVLSKL